jgi:UV excision repair protein RAD23
VIGSAEPRSQGIPEGLGGAPPPPATSSAPLTTPAATSAAPSATPAAPAAPTGPAPRNLFEAAAAHAAQAPAAGGAAGGAGSADLVALQQSPEFQQLRQLVRQNPAMLQPFLQTLAQSNPGLLNVRPAPRATLETLQLVQVINNNQQAFIAALEAGDDGSEGGPDPSQYISVTPAEQEAIQRLEALVRRILPVSVTPQASAGVSARGRLAGAHSPYNVSAMLIVLQAYLACDRNGAASDALAS